MPASVQWRLMFRVNNRAALDELLGRAMPLFGTQATLGEGKPYWKIPELWECSVVTPSPDGSAADKVLACLTTAQAIGAGWYVLGSVAPKDDGFTGVFAADNGGTPRVSCLVWASFDLRFE